MIAAKNNGWKVSSVPRPFWMRDGASTHTGPPHPPSLNTPSTRSLSNDDACELARHRLNPGPGSTVNDPARRPRFDFTDSPEKEKGQSIAYALLEPGICAYADSIPPTLPGTTPDHKKLAVSPTANVHDETSFIPREDLIANGSAGTPAPAVVLTDESPSNE